MSDDTPPLSSLVRANSAQLEDKLLRIEGNLPAVLYEYESDLTGIGRFVYITKQWEVLSGVPRAEVLADIQVAFGLIHRDDIQRFLEANLTAVTNMIVLRSKFRLWTRQGKMKWVELVSSPSHSTEEGLIVWNGLMIDITAEKAAQERIIEMVQSLSRREREVFDGLGVGKTLKEIGKALGISPSAIKATKARIMRKLGARNQSELVVAHSVSLKSNT